MAINPDSVRHYQRRTRSGYVLRCATFAHWRAAVGILEYVRRTTLFGISFQRGILGGLSLQVFGDAVYGSKAAYRRTVAGGLVACGVPVYLRFVGHRHASHALRRRQSTWRLQTLLKICLRQVGRHMSPDGGMPCELVNEDNQVAVQLAQNHITALAYGTAFSGNT